MRNALTVASDLDEDCQTVVGVPGGIQVVFVFLSDVWHHHVDKRLHGVMEGRGEALIPGQLWGVARMFMQMLLYGITHLNLVILFSPKK